MGYEEKLFHSTFYYSIYQQLLLPQKKRWRLMKNSMLRNMTLRNIKKQHLNLIA